MNDMTTSYASRTRRVKLSRLSRPSRNLPALSGALELRRKRLPGVLVSRAALISIHGRMPTPNAYSW